MNTKRIINILLTLIILGAVFYGIAYKLTKNKKENAAKTALVAEFEGNVSVRVSDVKKEILDQKLFINGNFIASQQMNFSSEISGRVIKVNVDEGSRVSKGQILAIIKSDQLHVDLDNAQAIYANAINDVKRFESAIKSGGVTQQQLDQAKLAVNNAEAKLAQAKIKMGDTYVKSTINGIVNKRMIEPGSVLSSGTPMFELVDVSKLKLAITVDENIVARIKEGDKISITASAIPDEKYSGKITFIAPKADATLNFPVEIELESNPANKLRAGMYGSAEFDLNNGSDVVVIPRSAFVGSVRNNQVYIVNDDSTAELKSVLAGRIVGDKVEVLNGLTVKDKVITSGQINLTPGAPITIIH